MDFDYAFGNEAPGLQPGQGTCLAEDLEEEHMKKNRRTKLEKRLIGAIRKAKNPLDIAALERLCMAFEQWRGNWDGFGNAWVLYNFMTCQKKQRISELIRTGEGHDGFCQEDTFCEHKDCPIRWEDEENRLFLEISSEMDQNKNGGQ